MPNISKHNKKSFFFLPLTLPWDIITRLRRFFYQYGILEVTTFDLPIISIGNLTLGGTGKTPFTIWLAQFLEKHSIRPLIVTRGHRGQLENKIGFLNAGKFFYYSPKEFGDESFMMVRSLTKGAVLVGKNRRKNLTKILHSFRPGVVLLEDGHQHLKIERNLNIVLFDTLAPFQHYQFPPLGRLREHLSTLTSADIIILTRSNQSSDQKQEELTKYLKQYASQHCIWGKAHYKTTGLYNCYFEKAYETSHLMGREVFVMAGLASPDSFLNSLSSLGAKIVEKKFFKDHHDYSSKDIIDFIKSAADRKCLVLTTEKDIVKIRNLIRESHLLYLGITIDLVEGKKQIISRIEKTLNMGKLSETQ